MSGDLVPTVIRSVEVCRLADGRATLAGTLPAVSNLLEQLRQGGQLVSVSAPVPDGRPGVYAVTVRLLPPQRQESKPPPRRGRGARFWAVVATVAVTAFAVLAWAVVALIQSLLDAAGRAADAVLPGLLGLIVVLGGIVAAAAVKGGGGFSGTFRGHMD